MIRYKSSEHHVFHEAPIHPIPMTITEDTSIWMGSIPVVVINTSNAILSQSPLNKYPSECIESEKEWFIKSRIWVETLHLSKSIQYFMSYGQSHNNEQYCQCFVFWCVAPIALTLRPMHIFHQNMVHWKALEVLLILEYLHSSIQHKLVEIILFLWTLHLLWLMLLLRFRNVDTTHVHVIRKTRKCFS
jgi:hypothetical protein